METKLKEYLEIIHEIYYKEYVDIVNDKYLLQFEDNQTPFYLFKKSNFKSLLIYRSDDYFTGLCNCSVFSIAMTSLIKFR